MATLFSKFLWFFRRQFILRISLKYFIIAFSILVFLNPRRRTKASKILGKWTLLLIVARFSRFLWIICGAVKIAAKRSINGFWSLWTFCGTFFGFEAWMVWIISRNIFWNIWKLVSSCLMNHLKIFEAF